MVDSLKDKSLDRGVIIPAVETKEVDTVREIGALAGRLWHLLSSNGGSNPTRLGRELGATPGDVNRAIGWLAREDKLAFLQTTRGETIQLQIQH
jgi:hypothetical protein